MWLGQGFLPPPSPPPVGVLVFPVEKRLKLITCHIQSVCFVCILRPRPRWGVLVGPAAISKLAFPRHARMDACAELDQKQYENVVL